MGKKSFDYFFRFEEARARWALTKWIEGDGTPDQTYYIETNHRGKMVCDCPAFSNYPERGPCKHIGWLLRYQAIRQLPEFQTKQIYYTSGDDAFYPLDGSGELDGKNLEKYLQKPS